MEFSIYRWLERLIQLENSIRDLLWNFVSIMLFSFLFVVMCGSQGKAVGAFGYVVIKFSYGL